MKNICLLIVLIGSVAFGQQMPQFSQFHRNQYMVNPGAAGVYDFLDLSLGGRMQWAGFDNAPLSSYLYASAPFGKKEPPHNPSIRISDGPVKNPEIKTGKLKHAMGGILVVDQYGAIRQLKGSLTYALHIPVMKDYNLSFGTSLGITNRAFLEDRAQTANLVDPGLGYVDPTYDQNLQNGNSNTMDVGAGLYFYSKRLFVGISADQLTTDLVSFGGSSNFDPRVHTSLTGGYKFSLSDNLTLTPSILAKYMWPTPSSLEALVQIEYKEWLWGALSYRQGLGGYYNSDAFNIMAGLNISQLFKFGYSFDYSISDFRNHSVGGHEICLGFMIGRKK